MSDICDLVKKACPEMWMWIVFYYLAQLSSKTIVETNPVGCEVCQYAMNYLDQILGDNATEQEIISALDSLCSKLPTSVKGEVSKII